jgi:hypothetical protein
LKKIYQFFQFSPLFLLVNITFGQSIQTGLPVFEEYVRRSQIHQGISSPLSFHQRPIDFNAIPDLSLRKQLLTTWLGNSGDSLSKPSFFRLSSLPIVTAFQVNSGVPYPTVSPFVNTNGFQNYSTFGVIAEAGPLAIRIQPEYIYARNLPYDMGGSKSGYTEFLERFGEGPYARYFWGQSSVKLNLGAFSLGASNENIKWGPGQFNSLLFSANAFGFRHLTLNTRRPAKTWIGSFEGQILGGILQGSNLSTSNLGSPPTDNRYLNGINFSYQPKWIPGLFVGASRVFQQYEPDVEPTLRGYFPIFEVFQKKKLFDSPSNSVTYDSKNQDQQLTGFVRYFNQKAKAELYFEYGRRDHAYDWREATLNPEHARAYLFGFVKLVDIANDAAIQIRGEMIQQQESINILVRYDGIGGGANWSGHGITHGFTHLGQMMGPGIGPSSNAQTLELAWVKDLKKVGLRMERLNRHQDLYIKYFNDPSPQGRWVDWSLKLLGDWQWERLILSSQVNFVNSTNYQWRVSENSNSDFPSGVNKFSFHSQVSLMYFLNKNGKK